MTTSPPTTFAELWERSVRAHGARPFLRFEASDGGVTEWSYAAFDDVVARTATKFVELGAGPTRGVHLALTNSPSFVAAWIAATRLGSFIVPSDPLATAHELAEHIGRTGPCVSVVSTARRAAADDALEIVDSDHADVRTPVLVAVDEDDPMCAGLTTTNGLAHPALTGWPSPSPTDRAAVMFTSGTTGHPKGVVVTQANYTFAGATMANAAGLQAGDRQLVVLPLFHANAQYYSFAPAIAVGASVALMHTFSASGFVEQAARHLATHASLFAGPMRMILARGGPGNPASVSGDDDPVSDAPALLLRHCWYAQNITGDQYETLAEWFGCRPRQLYGMTETIPAVLTDSADDPRHDSMGFVTPGCHVDIHGRDGAPVAPGEVGEIVVGGQPGITLFAGYLDDPDTTGRSFRDGWFLTGDRARRDDEGRFFFDGRRSDVLKVSGENVSVVEVEAVLGAHPDVFDVVVVGAPDPIRDEVPVAFVVPGPGASEHLADDLTRWCETRLGKAKRPRSYSIVDELPRTSVGKVRTFILREAAATPNNAFVDPSTTIPKESRS